MNLNRYYDRHAPTIVVALNDKDQNMQEIRQALYSHFIPHKAVIWRRNDDKNLLDFIPFVQREASIKNNTTLYICHEGVCQQPIHDRQEILDAINRL